MIDSESPSRALLLAGIAAGLLFLIVPTIEIYRRPAFDISRHAISMLSLGDGGWIMKSVFILSGLLTLACAWGIRQTIGALPGGLLAPLLVGIYGCGLVMAGLYDAPAGLGFPAGTPLDQQPIMTRSANLHGMAFMIAFSALILCCFVFAWHFAQQGAVLMAGLSLLTGLALPTLVWLGMSSTVAPGIAFYWAAMVGWAWLGASIVALPHPS